MLELTKCKSLILAIVLQSVLMGGAGCREKHEPPSYIQQAGGAAVELVFEQTQPEESTNKLLMERFSESITTHQDIIVSGTCKDLPNVGSAKIRAVVYRLRPGADRLIFSTGVGTVFPAEEGISKFEVHLKAPTEPGRYRVAVEIKRQFIGYGEIEVIAPG